MPKRAPVVAGDGSEIGTAEKVLGDEEDDIFHGIVVRRHDGHVITDLAASEAESLPAYRGS